MGVLIGSEHQHIFTPTEGSMDEEIYQISSDIPVCEQTAIIDTDGDYTDHNFRPQLSV